MPKYKYNVEIKEEEKREIQKYEQTNMCIFLHTTNNQLMPDIQPWYAGIKM